MLGHANRVAVLHVLDQGPNGSTVPPHAEYLDGRMGRAVEELAAPHDALAHSLVATLGSRGKDSLFKTPSPWTNPRSGTTSRSILQTPQTQDTMLYWRVCPGRPTG